jgi:hypothetical protein
MRRGGVLTPGEIPSLRHSGRSAPIGGAARFSSAVRAPILLVAASFVIGLVAAPTSPAALDPTPPVIVPEITGTLGSNGWYTSSVTVRWSVSDPESGISDTFGCDTRTVTADTKGTSLTCSATNGAGLEGSYTATVKLDRTAPAVAGATPGRTADANGWYNHAVGFTFTGTDATSGIDACPSATYSGPDSGTASITGTCRDKAGNSASRAFTLAYDATGPSVAAAADRGADANGWYNHEVTFAFSGSDATSGIASCDAPATYGGPDSGAASVSGSCRDRAGNESVRSFGLKYDETAPGVTGATASRGPDRNGWYNHPVSFTLSGADGTSGIEGCMSVGYAGPDSETASVAGTCTDQAGNRSAARSFGLKYDATAPTVAAPTPARPPDANGWYRSEIAFTFSGSDAVSKIETCTAPTYSGPDSDQAAVTGSCRDNAGNSASRRFTFAYDATAPAVSAAASRAPDANGWYNHAVTISFSGTDATSGIESCDAPASYGGPDSGAASVSGSCRDRAGNTASRLFALKYDATAPTVAAPTPARPPDANGWYNHAVPFSVQGTDAVSRIDACGAPTYGGPDSAETSVVGTCRDNAGNAGTAVAELAYDATPPEVTGASPARVADRNGWYNHPVEVVFEGADVTSGLESCEPLVYGGPDTARASVSGACRDVAGNRAGPFSFPLSYDATPPSVRGMPARPPDRYGWYARPVGIAFVGDDAWSGVETCDAVTYSGPNADPGSVTGNCADRAGNTGTGSFAFRYAAPLLTPPGGARVSSPPLLDWVSVDGARHYNVQVWRRGVKILSAWPVRSQFQLRRTWRYKGKRYRLEPGKRHAWYVWPRLGPGYGQLVGRSSFVFRPGLA